MTGVAGQGVALGQASLDRLMPMHLCLSPAGTITGCGPTLRKIDPKGLPIGAAFFDLFQVRRPGGITSVADLAALGGRRLYLLRRGPGGVSLRGLAVPMADGRGLILNLSFGWSTVDTVRARNLTEADFAPTDLAVELLCMIEANTAITKAMQQLNLRMQEAKAGAEEQAMTDTLTGLRNRRAMNLALADAIGRRAPFALMHLDLDFFKTVNDTHGHAAGDHVLRAVAQVLTAEVRQGDTVARVGGDEFVILLPGATQAPQLHDIAARMIAGLNQPIEFEGEACRISASIGMAVSDGTVCPDAARLQAEADAALYASKRAGRGRATIFGAG